MHSLEVGSDLFLQNTLAERMTGMDRKTPNKKRACGVHYGKLVSGDIEGSKDESTDNGPGF